MIWISVAAGGALGAVLRYLAVYRVAPAFGLSGTAGIFAVNAVGSFLMGLVMVWLLDKSASPELRLFLTVGFLGALTTFSTYSADLARYIQSGEYTAAVLYGAGSVRIGLLAFLSGSAVAKAVL